MVVRRIVTNTAAVQIAAAKPFYCDVLGMAVVMDLGWVLTFAADRSASPQVSVAAEWGLGTKVPDISIEVDDVDQTYERARAGGFASEYGPVNAP